jgi:3-demethoxyubiquinol 3-hydroxylase
MAARDRLTISRILRVNHAGEYGAVRIYGAQLALTGRAADTRGFLQETLGHERKHLKRFADLMPARGTRPCGALPIWGMGGTVLGLFTVGLGRNAVLTCTEAVERSVHRHLVQQLAWLADRDPALSRAIHEIQVEELGHLAFAVESKTANGWGLKALDGLVTGATEILIWLSTYGASARMARDIRQ